MELRFDPNQEFQTDAVQAVVDLFENQTRVDPDMTFALSHYGFAAVPNRIDLDEKTLLANLAAVQSRHGIAADDSLRFIEGSAETAAGPKAVKFLNFSVEMETGTGKTYVYLRTALELYRRYGMRKFIVVVPSIAIREGVFKTLDITRKHFAELFGNLPYRYYAYKSENLSQVRNFALSGSVEIMVMTIDSFNKELNVIHQSADRLQGETPIHLVQASRPVLILDEPQNMESEKSVAALAALDPLMALRYSATHRNPYNLVYRLSPFEAYRQGLVKRIEVASVVAVDDVNQAFIRLESVKAEKRTLTARLAVHKLMKDNTVKEKVVTVRPGEALEKVTNRPEYAPFVIDEISASAGTVLFANGTELKIGQAQGTDKDALFRAQILDTVEEHFRKQAKLRPLGIKVLSLFFIDRVDNYAREDGIIRRIFRESFDEKKQHHAEWKDFDANAVQAAYFAQSRHRTGEVEFEDTSGRSRKDEAAYNLIMKDKERLLSFDEPVSFIFSHSALREGWDSPNVFQICTLNQSASEMRKRQEIGRGVRLAVNQSGERVRDEQVNVLTVVANENYERYVATLQQEIEDEYGKEGLPPKPANARRRGKANLRKEYLLRPEFKELWERIRQKTRYMVKIDGKKLIDDVVADLDTKTIAAPRVVITKVRVEAAKDADVFDWQQMSGTKTVVDLAGRYPLPNVIETLRHLLENVTPPVRLTRGTLLAIFGGLQNRKAASANPHEFATVAARVIREKLADHLVRGIQYEKIDGWYEMSQFQTEIESWKDCLVPAAHSLYDKVVFESEPEREFVEGLEKRDDVVLYVKLPGWFVVDTPVGTYNPDWAIVVKDTDAQGETAGEALYLVRETKHTADLDKLHPDERRKIHCGKQHFSGTLHVDYKVVTRATDVT